MSHALQDRRRDDDVSEHLATTRERLVRRRDHHVLLVPPGDPLEEQVLTVPVDWNVADLIDGQQLGLAVQLETLFQPVLNVGSGEQRDQRPRGDELDLIQSS